MALKPICIMSPCTKKAKAMGLCASHYHHAWINGELPKIEERNMGAELREISRLADIPVYKLGRELGISSNLIRRHVIFLSGNIRPEPKQKILERLKLEREKEYSRLRSLLFS